MKPTDDNSLPIYQRLSLLSWLVLPLIALWIMCNYIVGLVHQPQWNNSQLETSLVEVANASTEEEPFEWKKTPLITLWFDDAWYTQYSVAFPVLEKHKMKAALAVTTGLVQGESYMTWPQIRRIDHKGWEITSHSTSHNCEPNKLSVSQIEHELHDSQRILAEQGFPTDHYVTPCGAQNSTVLNKAKHYYLSLRTSESKINPLPVKNPYQLFSHVMRNTTTIEDMASWIEQAKTEKGWLIITFHQIDNEHREFAVTPELFEQIIVLLEESAIPIVLPYQALEVSQL